MPCESFLCRRVSISREDMWLDGAATVLAQMKFCARIRFDVTPYIWYHYIHYGQVVAILRL
jgi:hypothetical protein